MDQGKEALYRYEMVARTADAAEVEFQRHEKFYAGAGYRNHRDSIAAMKTLCLADADYLRAMILRTSDQDRRRTSLLISASPRRSRMGLLIVVAQPRQYEAPR